MTRKAKTKEPNAVDQLQERIEALRQKSNECTARRNAARRKLREYEADLGARMLEAVDVDQVFAERQDIMSEISAWQAAIDAASLEISEAQEMINEAKQADGIIVAALVGAELKAEIGAYHEALEGVIERAEHVKTLAADLDRVAFALPFHDRPVARDARALSTRARSATQSHLPDLAMTQKWLRELAAWTDDLVL